MLLFFGVEPIVNIEPQNPSETDPASGVVKARVDGEAADAINPDQYDNPDNPGAHEKWTGPQIWEQTGGKIDIFCAGLGTTGTLIDNLKFLKKQNPKLRVVGIMRVPDQYVPGVRTENLLKLVGFDWRKHVDFIEGIETAESYQTSMALSRLGILAEPSSGLALTGLLKHLKGLKNSGDLRNAKSGEITCVFPCPDSPIPYLDEYFKYVDRAEFPPTQNEGDLVNMP